MKARQSNFFFARQRKLGHDALSLERSLLVSSPKSKTPAAERDKDNWRVEGRRDPQRQRGVELETEPQIGSSRPEGLRLPLIGHPFRRQCSGWVATNQPITGCRAGGLLAARRLCTSTILRRGGGGEG